MLVLNYSITGTKHVFKDDTTGDCIMASYEVVRGTPEVLLMPCSGTGRITSFVELYGEAGSELTPSDAFKVVERYNNGAR